MIRTLRHLSDQLFGRGDAATTIPPFDGPLKPNQILEAAPIVLSLEGAEDLASDGEELYVAAGSRVFRLAVNEFLEIAHFEAPITALCCVAEKSLAVAIAGREIRILGGIHDGKSWREAAGRPFMSVNAIARDADGRGVLVTEGSRSHRYEDWCHDLMARGTSGRAFSIDFKTGDTRGITEGLSYAFGICTSNSAIWVSESWAHRLMAYKVAGDATPILENLPVYPSRLSPAAGGGFWLTAFLARTQLVEFVLREPRYRERMMREIEPQFWIAPRLTSGHSYLEPMQGAHIKTMGILKPWAPPRSYGLIIRLTEDGLPIYSLHSRAGGTHHGVTSVVECGEFLYVLAKGDSKILALSLASIEQEFPR
ncbi:MAG: hypothetical protein ACP5M5_08115 [Acidibrevibacterium sp.]|uniref:hypothetical protein n=1 Tax=Acidibrevibacterium sp. TaxID=2606776 RepID=UPI003D06B52E